MTDHWLCGWRVRSDLPLPDLLAWRGGSQTPDVRVLLGDAPPIAGPLRHAGPLLQVAHDGTCRYEVPSVATYLVRGGTEVVVKPHADPAAPDVRVFLLGSVFGILCHQRGVTPLHACCVDVGGVAIAVTGPSGYGKSTLAAAFMDAGHAVLSDDVTVIDQSDAARPMALPTFPRLKLWAPALAVAGAATAGLERSRAATEKFHLPIDRAFLAAPRPLAAIYHLGRPGGEATRLAPLAAVAAVSHVHEAVYRPGAARHLGRAEAVFANAARLVAALGGQTHVLERAWGLARAREVVACLAERHLTAA